MAPSHGISKTERVTITLLPTSDERSYRNVPTTFSVSNRSYEWRSTEQMRYMLVPRKISSSEIQVDLFVGPPKGGKLQSKSLTKVVQDFVRGKIESEWRGLKLGNIGKPTTAVPPQRSFVRGTIEEMLGANLKD